MVPRVLGFVPMVDLTSVTLQFVQPSHWTSTTGRAVRLRSL